MHRYIVSGENDAGRYVYFQVDATSEDEATDKVSGHPWGQELCCFSACPISEATRYQRDNAMILSHAFL